MKRLFAKIAAFLRRNNISYHRKYDTSGAICTGDDLTSPKFSYAFKGDYTISLGRILGFFAAIVTLILTVAAAISFFLTSVFSLTAFTGLGKLNRMRRRFVKRRKKKLKLRAKAKH